MQYFVTFITIYAQILRYFAKKTFLFIIKNTQNQFNLFKIFENFSKFSPKIFKIIKNSGRFLVKMGKFYINCYNLRQVFMIFWSMLQTF
ncbi:hypothetical protein B0182_08015 [Moraxella bovis]|nr:hypothetical protein DQF64_13385 [Moraxella bovis]OOR89151.1 hypothetical protein B0182_08015 [Moraxella bovis]